MYLNVTFQDCEQHANKIRIVVEEDEDAIEQASDYEASIHDGDFAGTFRRLQHVCIRDFRVGISDSPFLRYWKSQKAAVFAVERIELDPPEVTDYDLLDSVVNHLRPKTTYDCFSWAECGYGREELKLLARKSFLNNLQTVRSMVFGDAFPPSSFFLKEPGYPNYELWCAAGSNVAAGIDALIESFVRDGCSNKKFASAGIRWDDASPTPKQLRKPTKIDMPLPRSWMSEDSTWWINDVRRVSQCEMHTYLNKVQWKRMEIYKWTVDNGRGSGRRTTHVLRCLVKTLLFAGLPSVHHKGLLDTPSV